MKEHHDSGTWLGRRLHLAAAVALGVPMSLALHASTGDAALRYDTGEFTRFEIDGDAVPGVHSNGDPLNAAVDGDWGSTPTDYGYGPQPIGSDPAQPAPAGLGSSGILPLGFDQSRADDYPLMNPVPNPQYGVVPGATEFCVESDDIWTGGTKAATSLVDIDDPLFGPGGTLNLTCGQALDKGDLFRAYAAYEVVAVPNVYGDPTSGSQNHTVLYGAWERGEEPGELNFYIPVSDSIAGNSAGDRLIAFDYNSSRPAAYRILAWNGSEWAVITSGDTGTNTTSFEVAVGYVDGRPFGASGRPSFGEFALDLTAIGVLPTSDGACVDLTTSGYIFTETGNSAAAQLKDYVRAPKLPIGNCGEIDVVKAGPEGASVAPEFGYRVEQVDQAAIFPTGSVPAGQSVNRIDAMIAIGETDPWIDVYAQADYLVYEPQPLVTDPASSGWQQVMVTCTYVDMFAAGYPIVTDQMLFDGTTHVPGTFLQVQSSAFLTLAGHARFVPSCTITNDAAGVIVEKTGVGDAGTGFGIDVGGQLVALHLGESAFIAADAGTDLTISEPPIVGASPNWDLTAIECFDEGATTPFITGDLASRSVDITTAGFDNTIRCVFTNVQRGSITIAKTVTPPLGAQFTFETTTLPGGDFVLGNGQSTTFSNLVPGVYGADEAAVPGWITQSISCVSAGSSQTQTETAAGLVAVTLAAGDAVTCTFTNAKHGPLTIAKSVTAGPTRVAQDTYTITYTVEVTSQSYVNEVYDLVDRVRFGEGVTVVSASAAGPTGVTLVPTWNGTTQTTLASDVSLAPQASHTYTVTASGKVQLTSAESSRDCVLATTETGTGMLNESAVLWHEGEAKADACRPVPPPEPADLAIVKSASVTATGPDGGFDWILSVTNKGPATAANVVVGDLVPTQLTVTAARSTEFTCTVTGNQVTCRKPTMATGETGTVTISVIVPGNAVSGSVVDVGTVISDTPDTDLSNNSDDAKVDIVVQLPPTTPPPSILPDTGTHSAVPVTTSGVVLLMIGGLALLVARIRRRGDLGTA